ncbi:MAG TPA: cytochrome P450 [Tepidisphaeraceae bacterium]|nr:cytochrome P450 [Tepidisphaeraceae bacterium]
MTLQQMLERISETPPAATRQLSWLTRLRFAMRRDILSSLERISAEQGDVANFKAGHWDYWFFVHPDAVRDVLVNSDELFIKGPALRRAKATLGEGLLTSEGDLHRRQRRLVQPVLHPQRVASYAPVMAQIARQTADAWQDGATIDLHEQMMKLTLRIVAKTLFDADVGAEVDAIGHAMDISVGMFQRAMTPWGPVLNFLPLPSNFRFKRAWGRLMRTIDGFIAERRANGSRGDDLLSRLLKATDAEGDGGTMSDQQLRDEAITLFTAGHETTANALTFTFYLLSQNPDAESRLHEELASVLGGREPTAEDVEKLSWTRMVLSESMRLYPPAWALGRESVRECMIAGHGVPAGAVVLLSQWITQRDPRWWPDPLRFDPLRFGSENRAARPRWTYFPFGGGSRQCIGESFAWMEAILVIAMLAQRWRMEFRGSRPPGLRPLITLRPDGPVLMKLQARKG